MRLVEVEGIEDRRLQRRRRAARDRGSLLARRRPARRGRPSIQLPVPLSAPVTARCSTCAAAGRRRCRPTRPSRPSRSGSRTARSNWRSTEHEPTRDSTEHRAPSSTPSRPSARRSRTSTPTTRRSSASTTPRPATSTRRPKGLTRQLVEDISEYKDEPQWMRDFRLKALDHFLARPVPQWGAEPEPDRLRRHPLLRARLRDAPRTSWEDVPEDIKNTFDKLGIPEAERKFLAGVGAQYESEVVYHQIREDLEKQGVIFTDMDTGLREYEDVIREHFATVIPRQRQHARRAQLGRLVGRLVRLRAEGRQGRDAAAGLLPDQHREHGPVRAHADHRRRGLRRALHRGLHGARSTRPTRCTPRSSS